MTPARVAAGVRLWTGAGGGGEGIIPPRAGSGVSTERREQMSQAAWNRSVAGDGAAPGGNQVVGSDHDND